MQVYTGYHKEQMKKHGNMVVKWYLWKGSRSQPSSRIGLSLHGEGRVIMSTVNGGPDLLTAALKKQLEIKEA